MPPAARDSAGQPTPSPVRWISAAKKPRLLQSRLLPVGLPSLPPRVRSGPAEPPRSPKQTSLAAFLSPRNQIRAPRSPSPPPLESRRSLSPVESVWSDVEHVATRAAYSTPRKRRLRHDLGLSSAPGGKENRDQRICKAAKSQVTTSESLTPVKRPLSQNRYSRSPARIEPPRSPVESICSNVEKGETYGTHRALGKRRHRHDLSPQDGLRGKENRGQRCTHEAGKSLSISPQHLSPVKQPLGQSRVCNPPDDPRLSTLKAQRPGDFGGRLSKPAATESAPASKHRKDQAVGCDGASRPAPPVSESPHHADQVAEDSDTDSDFTWCLSPEPPSPITFRGPKIPEKPVNLLPPIPIQASPPALSLLPAMPSLPTLDSYALDLDFTVPI
ncbi:hypothetical protein HDU88_007000 [Geranomyces variabilis]|nr:hypothetical protein HDU88_007000 [Geranomyces variabilis]